MARNYRNENIPLRTWERSEKPIPEGPRSLEKPEFAKGGPVIKVAYKGTGPIYTRYARGGKSKQP
jgi:hypothetical protein